MCSPLKYLTLSLLPRETSQMRFNKNNYKEMEKPIKNKAINISKL